ncbi:cryptochrome/photolyase family protein [Schleiferia thermophila]|uniref:Deoxyribodipyrimidine photo-lyase n=1 Tax=Schleiferia thermophila TaxID=884107 RepID=A0A369A8F0_9FLAO|nr:deoxyribodipyrimidine photo-lyase [Schleiferia thermophila]RCX05401.1 deoxyribodipyrimidine photo-lyase [Schleiferia thermophila]GCD79093.1 deoxyribodipyrimidine photo-lyase [Schleiferia thermophila]
MNPIAIHWFRRDLRLEDNAALYHALKSGYPVLGLFIFDRNILDKLHDKRDRRVHFIYQEIKRLKHELEQLGSTLIVRYGLPEEVWISILKEYHVARVFANRDYEPYAQQRDRMIYTLLLSNGIKFSGYKDHVIFEKEEILKDNGQPYTVYTPYSRKWKEKLSDFYLNSYPTTAYLNQLYKTKPLPLLSLSEIGFIETQYEYPSREINTAIIANYHKTRDFPAVNGTTRLSVHLRFGTISIRKLAHIALHTNEKYLNELIWRDFYQMILYHFPFIHEKAFKPEYDNIKWENNEDHFKAWCEGQTGYPIIDAGMRELNTTGFMHNRVRMIVSSFLTKHLLIDWRWGERYFAEKLLDYEMGSNVGGWQWAAGSGNDAAPYFRIFNPQLQTDKFDKQYEYIKKWVPEYNSAQYPQPLVDHSFARNRAIERYKAALEKK